MNSIQIVTGQNVIIDYKPASILDRMLATLLDWVFQTVYVILVVMSFSEMDIVYNFNFRDKGFILFFIVLILPLLLYNFLFEALMGGQTPGKAILKIKVTDADGSATGIGGYFLRWLLRPIDMICYGGVGALCIILTQQHQRIGDMAAGTIVVKTVPITEAINSGFYDFQSNYQPRYPQVEKLSETQVKLISDILESTVNNNDEYEIYRLAIKTKEVLGATSSQPDRDFLETVVKDYNYYTSLGV